MSLSSFYEVTAALCFTLLGFWWLVIQMRHEEFTSTRAMRATAYHVSMSFVLPGIMSLTALLATENNALWRFGFGIAAVIGAVHTLSLLRGGVRHAASRWVMLALYVVIGVLAAFPRAPRSLGLDLSGLAVEGTIVALFIFLGVNIAWQYFMTPSDTSV